MHCPRFLIWSYSRTYGIIASQQRCSLAFRPGILICRLLLGEKQHMGKDAKEVLVALSVMEVEEHTSRNRMFYAASGSMLHQ